MIPFLAAVAFAGLDQPIDFLPDAASAVTMVARLKEATGVPMRAAKNVESDIVAIAAPHTTGRSIMDHLAEAIDAKWAQEDGEWVLSRTAAQEKAELAAYYRERSEPLVDVVDLIDSEKIGLNIPADRSEELWRATLGMQGQTSRARPPLDYKVTPAAKLVSKLVHLLGYEFYGRMGDIDRVVFALDPTPTQRSLPSSAAPLIAQFWDMQNRFAKAYADSSGPGFVPIQAQPFDHAQKLLLIFDKSYFSMVCLSILDDEGQRMDLFGYPVLPETGRSIFKTPSAPAANVDLRPTSRLAFRGRPGSMPDLPDGISSFFFKPTQQDPLALVNTESVQALARQADKPVIAVLPEFMMTWFSPISRRFTTADYEQKLVTTDLLRSESDAWIEWKTAHPWRDRTFRTDRKIVERVMDQVAKTGFLSLDTLGDAINAHPGIDEGFLFDYLRLTGIGDVDHSAQARVALRL